MAQMIEVLLPDIGDFHDVEIIEILVQPGDRVDVEDPLITLESDKASMEIPSPHAGTVGEVKVALGDKINQGDLLMTLDSDATAADAGASAEDTVEPAEHTEDAPALQAEPAAEPAAAPVAAAGGDAVDEVVPLPDIGDFHDVEIIEILVSPGDTVDVDQSLITLESDKATMEIPAPVAGVVNSSSGALVDGDILKLVWTVAGSAGDQAKGLVCTVNVREDAS